MQQRGRLVTGLLVFGALGILSAVGIGTTLHGWSETQDSLDHWRSRLASAPADTSPADDPPAARVRRLEEQLDKVPERLFAQGVVLALSVVMLVLGIRAWRRLAG